MEAVLKFRKRKECFKTSTRNSVQHKKAVLDPFLRWAPHSKTFAQMFTITLLDELELQKHLNAYIRKVVTRTCPGVSDLLRFRSFHSTPFAKSCVCHVIIMLSLWSKVASTSGRFKLKEIFT